VEKTKKKLKQRKKEVRVYAYGNSSTSVTGSIMGVSYADKLILIDCGMIMESSKYHMYQANKSAFKDIPMKKVTDVFLSHALHTDHAGLVSYIYASGYRPKIHMMEGTDEIFRLMQLDCARINESDCKYLSSKYGKELLPLFNESDVDDACDNIILHSYNKSYAINEFMEVEFISAGHIYQSANIIITVKDGNYNKKIAYLVDLGNPRIKKPCVQEIEYIKSANLVIAECTYGMQENRATMVHRKEDLDNLSLLIKETCGAKNSPILISSFAMQRSLELLEALYQVWEKEKFDYPVYLDTPLGIKILTEMELFTKDPLFGKLKNWKNLTYISDFKDTKAHLENMGASITIATSGFASGGRILAYFTKVLPDKNATLLTAGYSSPDSNMGMVKKRLPIKIMNDGKLDEYDVKCRIEELTSFSSHIQGDDLEFYLTSIRCEKLVLLHGESERKYALAERMVEKYGDAGRTTKVLVLNKNEYVNI